MHSTIIRFSLKTVVLLSLIFTIHILILKTLDETLFDNMIVASYVINGLLAIVIFYALFLLKHKFKNELGFLFMAGSLLKFVVFFIWFHPIYKQDGNINTLEFFAFFVPYLGSLFIETFSLSKWLNKIQ